MPRPPALGIFSATTLVAASMIGVGVYTTSGFTLAALGSPQAVVLAWIVGGMVAICGAIGYASMATKFTESGGEYLFLARSLHPIAGVLAGLVSMLNGFTGAIAIAALGLEQYARPMLEPWVANWPVGTIAVIAVLAAATLHSIGVHGASRIQDAIVVGKLLMIAAFIILAIWPSQQAIAPESVDTAASPDFSWLIFAEQLVWISFSYAGFNAAIYISGEVKDAARNVPRAMIGGTCLVAAIYVLLNWIFVTSAPREVIIAEDNISQIAATSAIEIGGEHFATLVRLIIVVSLATSVSAMVMTGPRVYAKMADDGVLPKWFRYHGAHVPRFSIWFQAAMAIAAISLSTLGELLGYLGLTLSLCSALTVAMVFVLRRRGQIDSLPLGGIPPAIYLSATLLTAGIYAIKNPLHLSIAVATLVLGTILVFIAKRRTR